MTWGKVDDNLAFHPKVIIAGNEAMGLWVRALSWSAQQLTDGIIPDAIISALHGEHQAHALVSAGLWHPCEGGYEFNDWSDYQPTREQVLAEREATRERSRLARAKANARREAESVTGGNEASARPKGKATRLSPDFTISKDMRDWAKSEVPGFDVIAETKVFVDYWTSKGSNATKIDWVATWRNWMRKAYSDTPAIKYAKKEEMEREIAMEAWRNERAERIAKQQADARKREEEESRREPPPTCKHGKLIIRCLPCGKELAEREKNEEN